MKNAGWMAMSTVVWSLVACGGGDRDSAEPPPASLVRLRDAAMAPALVASATIQRKSLAGVAHPKVMGTAAVATSASAFFDWAQRTYPALFPGVQADRALASVVYRYYPVTETYLAVNGDLVLMS